MGIKLITEVMDHAPMTLTQREHKTLIIFAEDARDGRPGEVDENGRERRVIWKSVESPTMLRRTRVKRTEMYAVIGGLIKKGCIEQITKGGGGHVAKYRILGLAPELCQEKPDTDPGVLCLGNPDTATGELRPGIQDAASESATEAASGFSGAVSGETGHSVSGKPGRLALEPLSSPSFGAPSSPADEEANPATPLPPPNPGDDNGSEPCGSDDQHSSAVDPLQALAEVGNARAGAGERPAIGNGQVPRGRHARPAEAPP
jgi:hypothetical protein